MMRRLAEWMRTAEPALYRAPAQTLALALVLAALAGVLRIRAADQLPVEWDELIYLRVAYGYAQLIEDGDWDEIPAFGYNREHPPLVKLGYASLFAGRERDPIGRPEVGAPVPEALRDEFRMARRVSAYAGAVQVGLVSLVHPIAGLFLAVNSYHQRYTSEALLDAPAGAAALLAVVAFGFAWRGSGDPLSRRAGSRPSAPLLALSAVALGLAVGSKYTYGLAGLVLWLFLAVRSGRVAPIVLFPLLATLVFVAVDPALWQDPVAEVSNALSFHGSFAQQHARHWWHPFAVAVHATHDDYHAQYFYHLPDQLLCAFAVLGALPTARRRPLWLVWAVAGVVFLTLWPTKWAHYQLLVTPALAVCAAYGVEAVGCQGRSIMRRVHMRFNGAGGVTTQ